MKKLLLTLFTSAMTLGAAAQFNGNGYYRVYNLGRSVLDKKMYYVYVDYNRTIVSTSAGTGQNFEAIALWQDTRRSPISDPASVVYAKLSGNTVDLEAQGTSVSQMTDNKLYLTQNGKANSYMLSAIKSGVTLYLWSSTNYILYHYIATTTEAKGKTAYKYWAVTPVSSSSDNYFGVKPTLAANGKYYAPFYAGFPFKFASSGMKAYYVKNYNSEHFALEEITSEVKPGKTPMLIECSSENPSDNRLDLQYGNFSGVSGNKLKGTYFCNDFMEGTVFPDARVTFNPKTMRTWNVENGQLVLSTNIEYLHESTLADYFPEELGVGYINSNESYLVVPESTNTTLTLVPTGVNEITSYADAAEPVSYSTIGGVKIDAPKAGMGVVLVKYADGTVRKVNY